MGTITLHHASGAGDFVLEGDPLSGAARDKILLNARRLLSVRNERGAADLLDSARFELVPGNNHFNDDDFHILHAVVGLPQYENIRSNQASIRPDAATLAHAVEESSGLYVRFVAVTLELLEPGRYEVFVCHATQDKATIAAPLVDALRSAGISSWYDAIEIAWGQSLVSKIQAGIAGSRFLIAVVSPAFLDKAWAIKELQTALAVEVATGKNIVLPLLVGPAAPLLQRIPFLREKRYLHWTGSPEPILQELNRVMQIEA